MKRFVFLVALAFASAALADVQRFEPPVISCDDHGICRATPAATQLLRGGGDYAVTPVRLAFAQHMPAAEILAQDPAPAPAPAEAPPVDLKAELLKSLIQSGVPLLLTLLGTLGVALRLGVGEWLKQRAQTSRVAAILAKVWNVVTSVVAHVEAGLKADVEAKLKASGGTLTATDFAYFKAEALRLTKEALGTDGLDEIESELGIPKGSGLDTFLSGMVEKAVSLISAAKSTPPAPVAAAVAAGSPS